jgi:cell wall-associated NlpC family hydrolase
MATTEDFLGALTATWLLLVVAGCSWNPPQSSPDAGNETGTGQRADNGSSGGDVSAGARVAGLAAAMIGIPYVYGGQTPEGFDCSGLVFYAYRETGIDVPRTSLAQYRAAKRIPVSAAQPGDLVFFRIGRQISHVGIYVGNNRFIHSPETGQTVKITDLDDEYYKKRFAGAGRIL